MEVRLSLGVGVGFMLDIYRFFVLKFCFGVIWFLNIFIRFFIFFVVLFCNFVMILNLYISLGKSLKIMGDKRDKKERRSVCIVVVNE